MPKKRHSKPYWIHGLGNGVPNQRKQSKLKHPSRECFLKALEKKYGLVAPTPVPVPLEHDSDDPNITECQKKMTVYRFSFKQQLLRILNNPDYMQVEKMVVNRDNLFGVYCPNEYLTEVQDGLVYQLFQEELKEPIEQDNWLLIGMILYIDKTRNDTKGRFCLEPVILYLTILDRETCAKYTAQILLGYINDMDLSSSAYKKSTNSHPENKGQSCRNYHRQLRAMLLEVIEMQNVHNLYRAKIWIFDKNASIYHNQVCKLLPFIVFIQGDAKSQDNIVGRFASHHIKTARGCLQCNVKPANILSNLDQWRFINWKKIVRCSTCTMRQVTSSISKLEKMAIESSRE